jgi:hypothetical protein
MTSLRHPSTPVALLSFGLSLALAAMACDVVSPTPKPSSGSVLPSQPADGVGRLVGSQPTIAPAAQVPASGPHSFAESDCACLGLPVASMESRDDQLICNFEWIVTSGDSKETNQVQLMIEPWLSEDDARGQIKAEADRLAGPGIEVTQEGDGAVYAIEAQGTGGFFYAESRAVFPKGYYLSTHLRGIYSGAGEARSILQLAQACMQQALER